MSAKTTMWACGHVSTEEATTSVHITTSAPCYDCQELIDQYGENAFAAIRALREERDKALDLVDILETQQYLAKEMADDRAKERDEALQRVAEFEKAVAEMCWNECYSDVPMSGSAFDPCPDDCALSKVGFPPGPPRGVEE